MYYMSTGFGVYNKAVFLLKHRQTNPQKHTYNLHATDHLATPWPPTTMGTNKTP